MAEILQSLDQLKGTAAAAPEAPRHVQKLEDGRSDWTTTDEVFLSLAKHCRKSALGPDGFACRAWVATSVGGGRGGDKGQSIYIGRRGNIFL